MRQRISVALVALAVCCLTTGLMADDAAPKKAKAKKSDRGFAALFNGKDLKNWNGDPKLWKVEKDEIVGTTTADNPLKANSFLSTKKEYGDFVLRVKVKLINHNSGIQFRSKQLPDYVLTGYQADVAMAKYFGMLYREKAGGFMDYWKKLSKEEQAAVHAASKAGDWNEFEITCRGDKIKMVLNGKTTCDIKHPEGEKKGVIGLQLHRGDPMEVRFKDISIKELKPREGSATKAKTEGSAKAKAKK